MKISCQFLKKLSIHLSYDSVIPLLGIYLKEMKENRCTKISRRITAASIVIAKDWELLKCPMTGKWREKPLLHVFNMQQ